jgi:hypothetical protein
VQVGDKYELTVGGKKSTGTVTIKSGGVLTLTPKNSATTFTATVTSGNITAMSGTITFTDNTTAPAPAAIVPANPPEALPSDWKIRDEAGWDAWYEAAFYSLTEEQGQQLLLGCIPYIEAHFDELSPDGKKVWTQIIGTSVVPVDASGTTIGGLAYSSKEDTVYGKHYKLSGTYDAALGTLTTLFGFEPSGGYMNKAEAVLNNGDVMFEITNHDYRLLKHEGGITTGVGWNKRLQ